MPTEHLILGVAFDTLATCIPARNPAARLEHINSIITNTINKEVKALVAFHQSRREGISAIVRVVLVTHACSQSLWVQCTPVSNADQGHCTSLRSDYVMPTLP